MTDERENRWKSLLRGARRVIGRLQKGDRRLGLSATDAHVKNDHPEEDFAVNLAVAMKQLFALKTAEEMIACVTGKADDGRLVDTIPVSQTSSSIWLDFSDAMIDLSFSEKDVPLAKFVSNMAYALKEGLDGGQVVPHFPEFREIENFRLVRLVWKKSLSAWYPLFEE
jgi:hypothetical protein